MALDLYVDHHVQPYVVNYLRAFGIDCLTLQEDGHEAAPDEQVLRRAKELRRIVLTYDQDFLAIHAHWLASGQSHLGIIHISTTKPTSNAEVLGDLLLAAATSAPDDLANRVERIPVK